MFTLKIWWTNINPKWRLVEQRTTFLSGSNETIRERVNLLGANIGYRKEIRHNCVTYEWIKGV